MDQETLTVVVVEAPGVMDIDGGGNVLAVSDTRIKRKHKMALKAVGNHYHAYSGLSYFKLLLNF